MVLDQDGRIDDINERGASMLGKRPEDLIGRVLDQAGLPAAAASAGHREELVLLDGGRAARFSLTSAPLRGDEEGRGTLIIFREITGAWEAEARYRSLFQNPHEVVALMRYVLDSEDNVIDAVFADVNELFTAATGLTRAEVAERTATEVLGLDAVREHLSILQHVRSRNERMSCETYYAPLDATVRNFFAPAGPDMFILSSMNVTKVARAMKALEEKAEVARRKTEEMEALMDIVPSAIWIADDPECKVITGNRAADLLYESEDDENVSAGTSKGVELNPTRRFFKNGRELRPEELPMQAAAATGAPHLNCEIDVLVPSGKRKTILGNAIPLFDNDGKVRGSVASFLDITERKTTEQRLKESEAKYHGLFDCLHEAVSISEYLFDEQGEVIDWKCLDANRRASMLFGKRKEELIGLKASQMVGEATVAKLLPMVRDMRASGLPQMFEDRFEPLKRDFLNMFNPFGKDLFISTSLDITVIKEAQRRAEDYSKKLERSNEELQQFAYVASHDLQEPLRMVTIYIGLLEKRHGRELSDEARRCMDTAVEGAHRMRQLVNDLLAYSRVDSFTVDLVPVDLGEATMSVMAELRPSIMEAEADIIIDRLPIVRADEAQMRQLLTNLVGNAIKFRRGPAPVVRISAAATREHHHISIEDNGIGIDPRHSDKLFHMFQRLHTREEYPGTGIGLAISKKIVERHGGRIWFESEVGKGTTFHFTLPRSGEGDQGPVGPQ